MEIYFYQKETKRVAALEKKKLLWLRLQMKEERIFLKKKEEKKKKVSESASETVACGHYLTHEKNTSDTCYNCL